MQNESFLCTGSTLFSSTTAAFIDFSSNKNKYDIDLVAERIKDLLRSEKKLDLPLIVEKLQIPTEIAIKAINKLRDLGYVKFENE